MSFMNIVAGVFHPRSIFMLDLPESTQQAARYEPDGNQSLYYTELPARGNTAGNPSMLYTALPPPYTVRIFSGVTT